MNDLSVRLRAYVGYRECLVFFNSSSSRRSYCVCCVYVYAYGCMTALWITACYLVRVYVCMCVFVQIVAAGPTYVIFFAAGYLVKYTHL